MPAPPPHGFHGRYGPGHWLWQPAPQYSGPCPQNPYWLQQLGGWHGAPPAWTPHSPAFTAAARGAPLEHWLWHPTPQYWAPSPQKPNWLQQRPLGHTAPPAWTPHCAPAFTAGAATGAPPWQLLWQPRPQ